MSLRLQRARENDDEVIDDDEVITVPIERQQIEDTEPWDSAPQEENYEKDVEECEESEDYEEDQQDQERNEIAQLRNEISSLKRKFDTLLATKSGTQVVVPDVTLSNPAHHLPRTPTFHQLQRKKLKSSRS